MAAVGSFVLTTADLGGGLTKYSIAWTSSAGGAVSGASFQLRGRRISQVKFVPGTGVSANYGATLLDADGVDLLMGKGASLSATAASITVPVVSSYGLAYNDPSIGTPPGSVTPTLSGAGNVATGRIDLIVGP
jgi:hypothetical protein